MAATSVMIKRPVHDVFARVSDFAKAPEWAPQMGRIEMQGPLREGASFREERRFLGRPAMADWMVTRFEPDRAIGLSMKFGPMRGRFAYLFEPAESGTQLTQITDVELVGPLSFLTPLIARETEKEEDAELGRLKKVLESR
jgi:hypothetical protein